MDKIIRPLLLFAAMIGAGFTLQGAPAAGELTYVLNRRLLVAAQNGDPELARRLLAAGASVHGEDQWAQGKGETALHKAAFNGNLRVMRILLKAGAKVDARDERGETPLLQACFGRQRAAVRLLLARGTDPDGATKKGAFPLQVAANQGFLKIAIMLRRAGANLNQSDKLGRTALQTAAGSHFSMTRWLLAVGAHVNVRSRTGATALMNAAAGGQIESARLLISAGADVNVRRRDGSDALVFAQDSFASRSFDAPLKMTRLLWAKGARPADPVLLMRKVLKSPGELVLPFLISKGFSVRDPRIYTDYQFHLSYTDQRLNAVLRKHGAKIPSKKAIAACGRRDYRALGKLVAGGAYDLGAALRCAVNMRSGDFFRKAKAPRGKFIARLITRMRRAGGTIPTKMTAKIWVQALRTGTLPVSLPFALKLPIPKSQWSICRLRDRPDLLRRLIRGGLDIHDRGDGYTLLSIDRNCLSSKVVKVLLEAGTDVHNKKPGEEPLTQGVADVEVLRLLLRAGVPIHSSALCSLMYWDYLWKERLPTARFLLSKGASPNCFLHTGRSLLSEAIELRHEPLKNLLLAAGGGDATTASTLAIRKAIQSNPGAALAMLRSGSVAVDRGIVALALEHKRRELYSLLGEHYSDPRNSLIHYILTGAYYGYGRGKISRRDALAFLRPLLKRGVNVNVLNGAHRVTPLIAAANFGDIPMMKLLLRSGADVHARNLDGKSALFTRDTSAVRLLLKHGARVYIRDNVNRTPLFNAVEYDPELIRLLMRHGADPHARGRFGDTPLRHARRLNRPEVLQAMGVSIRGSRSRSSTGPARKKNK